MEAAGGDDLIEGISALERADWETAGSAFERVLDAGDVPDAYEGLGLARWFLGDVAAGIAARERAFESYVRARRCDDAARMAVWV
ncbi:MAG: LuxR family transcriptional regulator, partial [Chloroflexota bacterium]|nr:LuxR family transcriptional regulator [Chloroflexota bacterium]